MEFYEIEGYTVLVELTFMYIKTFFLLEIINPLKKTSQLPIENTKMENSHYTYEKWLQNFRLRLLLTLPNFNRKNQGEKQKTMIILL